MLPPNSSADLDAAIEKLAALAVARRHSPRTYFEKQALSGSDILSALGKNPSLGGAAIGGLLGAGAGGLNTLLTNQEKPREERKGILESMLTGGLAGAGVGAGAGLAHRGLKGLTSGGLGAAAPVIFEYDGKKFQISPEALAANPDLLAKTQELTSPSWFSQGYAGAKYGLGWAVGKAPVSATLMGPALIADTVLSSDYLRTGDGRLGIGMIDPANSQQKQHLGRGIRIGAENPGIFGIPHEDLTNAPATHPALQLRKINLDPDRDSLIAAANATSSGKALASRLPASFTRQAREIGAEANFADLGKNTNWYAKAPSQPSIFRGPKWSKWLGGGERDLKTTRWSGSRGGMRLLAGVGAPLLEAGMWNALGESRKRRSLQEIMDDLRAKNLVKDSS